VLAGQRVEPGVVQALAPFPKGCDRLADRLGQPPLLLLPPTRCLTEPLAELDDASHGREDTGDLRERPEQTRTIAERLTFAQPLHAGRERVEPAQRTREPFAQRIGSVRKVPERRQHLRPGLYTVVERLRSLPRLLDGCVPGVRPRD